MNALLIYIIKTALYLAVFYLIYSVFLRKDTTHARNRLFILISLVLSLILPLITLTHSIKLLNIQFFGYLLSEVLVKPSGNVEQLTHSTPVPVIIFRFYVLIGIVFLIKIFFDLGNLLIMITRNRSRGSRIIRFKGTGTSGFSALGYIFINDTLTTEDKEDIIRHEQNHLNQNHFLDIIFIETIKAFQWFNPAVYLFDRSLRAVHEYQADEKCLTSGVSIVSYQSLLFRQVFKSGAYNLSNSFANPSLLKKRMAMMTRKPTSAVANAKLLLVIPVIALVFLTISASKSDQNSINSLKPSSNKEIVSESGINPLVNVEEMPEFPGGDAALLNYISQNTRYPELSAKQGETGKVIVRFCVNTDGSTCLINILQGVSPELDKEAMRVVKSLPSFRPGRNGGKAVPVWYMVPIQFTLQ